MPSRACLLFLLALVWIAPTSAMAEQTDAAAAEALFQEGRDGMTEGDYESACTFFAESFSLDPAVGTILNLATCEEKRGHLADSWERWHQALDLLDENDDRVAFALAQLASIEERIAHLTIRVKKSSGSKLTVERDGVALGEASWGLSLPADPGEHVVVVQSPDHEPQSFTISLAPGQKDELVVSPGRRKPKDSQASDNGRTARLAAGIAAGSVGVAGVATAIVTGLMLPSVDKKVRAHCPQNQCDEEGSKSSSQAKTLLAVNMAAWIVGGVGLATGGVLLFTLPKSQESAARGGSSKPPQKSAANQHDLRPGHENAPVALGMTYVGNGVQLFGSF